MEYLGINYEMKHAPKLDPTFIPFGVWRAAYLDGAKQPIAIAVERDKGRVSVHHTCIHGTPEMAAADNYYIDRLVKTLLWMKGGFRVYVTDKNVYDYLNSVYCAGGAREFDWDYMANVFESPFEIVLCDEVPENMDLAMPIGGHLDGSGIVLIENGGKTYVLCGDECCFRPSRVLNLLPCSLHSHRTDTSF